MRRFHCSTQKCCWPFNRFFAYVNEDWMSFSFEINIFCRTHSLYRWPSYNISIYVLLVQIDQSLKKIIYLFTNWICHDLCWIKRKFVNFCSNDEHCEWTQFKIPNPNRLLVSITIMQLVRGRHNGLCKWLKTITIERRKEEKKTNSLKMQTLSVIQRWYLD